MELVYQSDKIKAYLRRKSGKLYNYLVKMSNGTQLAVIGGEMTEADWQGWEKENIVIEEDEANG